ncbi:hypothetical protein [Sansalvadorimonas verongulae]|uniref:hypothetical protein n=1 Tax=Sansalvadorimonas verongulae TaxID=2172824 RepID=UPI0012BC5189|nr:hypothetical protein [Sansalvadorimonas verongulae]MTI12272.1 hypothetical protein [Sansalvadorimonas verongulae]
MSTLLTRPLYAPTTTVAQCGVQKASGKTGARFGINMVAAVSGEGRMRYMTIPRRFNTDTSIKFLKQIVRSYDCPVTIVTDDH